MRIENGRVVTMEYEVRTEDGAIVEQNEPGVSTRYLHGAKALIPAMEKHLEGCNEGDTPAFVIRAAEAYGSHDPDATMIFPRILFPSTIEVVPGNRLAIKLSTGQLMPVTIIGLVGTGVKVDLNHPLAGKDLHFKVKIISVEPVSSEEIFSGQPLKRVEIV